MTTSIAENGGIFAACAVLSFGGIVVGEDSTPDHSLIWINAVGQLITGFFFDFVGLVAEAYWHDFEWDKVLPRNLKRVAIYVFIVITLGGTRLAIELILLFCPTYSAEHGVILHQCDRPSIFQAITFAFVRRNQNSSIGRYFAPNGTEALNEL